MQAILNKTCVNISSISHKFILCSSNSSSSSNSSISRGTNLEFRCHVFTEQNKIEIVKLGALQPLLRLTKTRDIRVKRNAAGALLNLSHVGTCCVQSFSFGHVVLRLCSLAANRISIVGEGGVPYLVQLLESQDEDIQFYCSATLSNIAVDGGRS